MKRLFLLGLLLAACGDGSEPEPVDGAPHLTVIRYAIEGSGGTFDLIYTNENGTTSRIVPDHTPYTVRVEVPAGTPLGFSATCFPDVDSNCKFSATIWQSGEGDPVELATQSAKGLPDRTVTIDLQAVAP